MTQTESPLTFHTPTEAPFSLSGVFWSEAQQKFGRIREELIPSLPEALQNGAWSTPGGMVRFQTNSGSISIKATLTAPGDMNHMPRSGSSGFDIYVGSGRQKIYWSTAIPGPGETAYEAALAVSLPPEMREWSLNFPLYNGVASLEIGLDDGCAIEAPTPFTVERPVLFYGSSITQGGCASRPGNAHPHIVCRRVDAPQINFGFSGSAKGEPETARAVAAHELSAFVMDYDHNTPSVEHLEQTHEAFFRIVRDAQPDLPVVIVSSPNSHRDVETFRARRDMIRRTYQNAVDAGDRHTFFVDGQTLFGLRDRDACTVDGCHPNDLGFTRMADHIYPAVAEALASV